MLISPDDPRLTAYALDELEPDAVAAFETALGTPENAEARRVVNEIKKTATLLTAELGAEPALGLTDEQRRRIEAGPAGDDALNEPSIFTARRIWAGAGLAAAACVTLALLLPSFLTRTGGPDPVAIGDATEATAPAEMLLYKREGAGEARSRERTTDADVLTEAFEMQAGAGSTAARDARERGRRSGGARAASSPDPSPGASPAASPGGGLAGGSPFEDRATPGPGGRAGAPPTRSTPDTSGSATSNRGRGAARPTIPAPGSALQSRAGGRESEAEPELQRGLADAPDELPWLAEADEDFAIIRENPFVAAAAAPLSTFSADVDTASYSNVRRILGEGRMPRPDVVRIEELVNYFPYDYAPPAPDDPDPFAVHVEVSEAPWSPEHRLARIGIKGREVDVDMRPATNLVFLVDSSGSMQQASKLPLVKQGLRMLVGRLTPDDRVAIVTYAGSAGVVLPSTYVYEREAILDAIDRIESGGSTHGSAGIQLAYDVASEHFIEGGVNRVILCTDGDFNVGVSDDDALVRLIEQQRESDVFLSVFGYGSRNLKDAKMEKLSNAGNGTYGYVDSIDESRKLFVEGLAGTLVTIAKDVKLQADFNPARVAAYRLIGYENRMLADRDFADDTKDAGEIGAGHTVTALYEIIPAGADVELPEASESDFVKAGELVESDLLMNVRVRYKQPEGDSSVLLVHPVPEPEAGYDEASADMQFASAVAAFGMVLRDSPHRGMATLDLAQELAVGSLASDPREQARRYLEDFVHYALVAKPELALANAEALEGLELDDAELERVLARSDQERLGQALERSKQIESLRAVSVDLEARLESVGDPAPFDPGLKYRAQFIDLVQQARAISGQ